MAHAKAVFSIYVRGESDRGTNIRVSGREHLEFTASLQRVQGFPQRFLRPIDATVCDSVRKGSKQSAKRASENILSSHGAENSKHQKCNPVGIGVLTRITCDGRLIGKPSPFQEAEQIMTRSPGMHMIEIHAPCRSTFHSRFTQNYQLRHSRESLPDPFKARRHYSRKCRRRKPVKKAARIACQPRTSATDHFLLTASDHFLTALAKKKHGAGAGSYVRVSIKRV